MKIKQIKSFITAAAGLALIVTIMAACAPTQTTDTRIGTLEFFDGFPDEATVVLFSRSLLTGVHFDRT